MIRDSDERHVFVKGIPERATKKEIMNFFSYYGRVENCKLKQDPITQTNLRYALLTFENLEVSQALFNSQVEFFGQKCECKRLYSCKPKINQAGLEEGTNLLVTNIPFHATDKDLLEALWMCPSISSCSVLKENPDSSVNQGLGTIVFHNTLGKLTFSQWIKNPQNAVFIQEHRLNFCFDSSKTPRSDGDTTKYLSLIKNQVATDQKFSDPKPRQCHSKATKQMAQNNVKNSEKKLKKRISKNGLSTSDECLVLNYSRLSTKSSKNGLIKSKGKEIRHLTRYQSTKAKIMKVALLLNHSERNYRLNGPASVDIILKLNSLNEKQS